MKKLQFVIYFIAISFASTAQNWDINTLESINPQNPNSVIMRGLTSSSYPVGAALPLTQFIVGYSTHNQKVQHQAWETVGSLGIAVVLGEGLKYAINRQRPYIKYPGEVHAYDVSETGRSFPSGHTTIAFATATTLSLEYKKWYVIVPAYAWAAGIGYSRLYLGEHYTSDVLGGAVIGTGSAFLSHWLTKKILRYRPPKYVQEIKN